MPLDIKTADAMLTDWDAWEQTLNDGQRQELEGMFRLEPDREAAKKRFAGVSYVAAATGTDPDEVSRRFEDYYLPAFAIDEGVGLGRKDPVKDAGQFFDLLKDRSANNRARLDTLMSAQEAAFQSAIADGNDLEDFATWQATQDHEEAWQGKAREAWEVARRETLERLGPDGRGLAKRLVRSLRHEMGVAVEEDAWINQTRSMMIDLKASDPEKYELVKAAAVAFNETQQQPEKGVAQGAAENLGRKASDIVAGSARTLVSMSADASAGLARAGFTNAPDPEALADKIEAGRDVDLDLTDMARGIIDPVKSKRDGWAKWAEDSVYFLSGSLPTMATAWLPGGQIALAGMFSEDAYNETRRTGFTGPGAAALAVTSGVIQGQIERFSELAMSVPVFAKWVAKWGAKPGSSWIGQFLIRNTIRSGVEYGEEFLQQITTPAMQELVAATGLIDSRPEGQKLTDVVSKFLDKDNSIPLALSVIPLGMLGAAASTSRDMKVVDAVMRTAMKNPRYLRAVMSEAKAKAVMEESDPAKREELIRQSWEATPTPVIVERVQEIHEEERQEAAAALKTVQDAMRAGMIPTIRRDAQGWTVEQNGKPVRVSTIQDAVSMAYSALDENERKAAEATLQGIEELMRMGGNRAEAFEVSRQNATIESEVEAGRVTPEQARKAVELFAEMHGLTREEAMAEVGRVLGNNRMEEVEGVRTAVSRIFGGGNIVTALHEGVHGRWNAGLERGHYSHAQGITWVRMAEQASGWQFLPTRDDAEVTPEMLSEAIVDVSIADLLGRRKDSKQHFSPGLISRGMAAHARAGRAQAKEAGKLATFLKAWREFWGQVTRAGRAMAKARREGKLGEDFDVMLDDLLGSDAQVRHDTQAAKDAASQAASMASEQAGTVGESFFKQVGKFFRVIVGDEAFQDIINTGQVRTNAGSKVAEGATLAQKLAARPTAFPSFSKDSAAMSYAGENPNHYIVVSESPSIKPSTRGRHSPGKTFFPTDEQGKHLESLPASEVQIYRHVGNGRYELAFDRGQVTSQGDAQAGNTPFSLAPSSLLEATKAQVRPGRALGSSQPTSKNPAGNGVDPNHNVDLARLRAVNPEAYRANALALVEYPIIAGKFPGIAASLAEIRKPLDKASAKLAKKELEHDEATKRIKEKTGIKKASDADVEAWIEANPTHRLAKAKAKAVEEVTAAEAAVEEAKKVVTAGRSELLKKPKAFTIEEADKAVEEYVQTVEANLEMLIKLFPKNLRDIARLWYDGANIIAQQFGQEFGVTIEQSAGVLAVFSPQKDWFMNVSLARRMLNVWTTQQDTPWSAEMTAQFIERAGEKQKKNRDGDLMFDEDGQPIMVEVKGAKKVAAIAKAKTEAAILEGKTLSELPPKHQALFVRMWSEVNDSPLYPKVTPHGQFGQNMTNDKGKELRVAWGSYNTIEKALNIVKATPENQDQVISQAIGDQHKVRSFYNNIADPANELGHVTMDTHAVAALLLMPLSGASFEVTQNFGGKGTTGDSVNGFNGTYAFNAEAYRRAAKAFDMLPREVQSITWEAVRLLFPAKWKSKAANVDAIRQIWAKFERNEITIDQARADVFRVATRDPRVSDRADGLDLGRAIESGKGLGVPSWAAELGDGTTSPSGSQDGNDSGVLSGSRGAGRLRPEGPGFDRVPDGAGAASALVPAAADGVTDFSLAPRSLVTVHNLSPDNLRHAIKMGGLAVPSLAVIRTDVSRFDNFGSITLVARPDLVDPQVNRDSKVFNADVYSPRYPTVKIIFKQRDADKIGKLFAQAFDELGQVTDKGWSWTKGNLVEDIIDKGFDRMSSNYLAQYAFARERGLIQVPGPVDAWDFANKELRQAVADSSDQIGEWVKSKIDAAGISYEEKVFAGFTNSGNRRFLPHNLDTVVKIMTRKVKDGEGFNYGVPSIRAANAKPFRSLKAIQDARGSIVTKEAMEAVKKEVDAEFMALAEEALALRASKPTFGALDAFSDDLKALVQGDIRWVRSKYGDQGIIDKMRDFVSKLRTLPSEYFEAKVQRAVALHEFEAAVVPSDLPDDLREALRKRGLEVVSYPRGDNEARSNAVENVAESVQAAFMMAPRSLASVADSVLAAQMRKPEFREQYLKVARERLDKLRKDGEWRVSKWGMASQREGADSIAGRIRTPANIEAERKFRQRSRQRELLDAGMATLTPETVAAYEQGLTTIKDDPLVSQMLDRGKLMSKTEAAKAGKLKTDGKGNAGDYDGAPWLPPSWYAGKGRGYMPDRMAQELHEAGLLKDAYPDTLWEALRSAIGSARAQNEAVRKAQAAVRAIEKNAAEQSRAEAEAWAKEERAKVPTAKQRQMLALRTLDVILSAFPPVVRGRVGGFVKLASLGSDQSREAEILRRLEKLDEVVEDEAKKHYLERIEKLFDRAKPKKEAGKKPQGKLGPAIQKLVDVAMDFSKLTEAEVAAERALIEARMEKATGAEVVELLERENLLDLFGALELRTSAEMETAHNWLAEAYTLGRNRWRAIIEARAADIEEMRADAIDDIGKLGLDSEQQAAIERARKVSERAKGMSYSWLSFEEVVHSVLGRSSKVAKDLVRAARVATNTKTDSMRAMRRAFRDAMAGIFGTTRQREWQEGLWQLSQIGSSKAVSVLKLEGARMEERTVPVEIIERIIAGEAIAKSYGLDALTMDVLEAAWAANEALPANRRKRVLTYTVPVAGSPTPTKLSQLQAVHVTMLARQASYTENMARHGWTADVLNEIEAQLTPETKAIRAWLADQYRDGYAPLNAVYSRMYGVNLPRLVNYAPGTFEARDMTGAEMDPYGQGLLSEGGFRAGMLKTRGQHQARPRLEDALAVYWGHVNATEHFKAFGEFARDLRGVLNEAEVRGSIKAKGGQVLLEAAQKWVEAFERNGLQAGAASRAFDEFMRKRQSVQAWIALAYNVGTLMKQSTAALGTLLNMGPTAAARQLGRLFSGKLELGESYRSEVIQRRIESGYSPEVRQAMAAMMAERPTWASEFLQRGMETIGVVDAVFTTASHAMAWDYHFNEAKKAGLTDVQARRVADEEAEASVARTAQPAEMMDRSLGELGMAPMAKFLFMFASEARQKAAIALEAYSPSSGLSKGERATRLLLLHVVFPVIIQTVSSAWRDARDDDDDELFDEDNWRAGDFLKAMILGPLTGIPIIGGSLNAALTPLFGGHYFANDPTQPLNKAATGADDILEAIEEGDLEGGLKGARSVLWGLAIAMGGERSAAAATVSNILFDLFRVVDNVIGEPGD
jgi:hypothetical protein